MDVNTENQVDFDSQFMNQALEAAKIAFELGEVPVGAVVTKNNQVISTAYNRRERDKDPIAHAEIIAIKKAADVLGAWRLTGCTLYVTLEPCPMCAGALVNSRIDRVVFGASDPKSGYLKSLHQMGSSPALNHQFEVKSQVCELECSQILKEFFSKLRQKN